MKYFASSPRTFSLTATLDNLTVAVCISGEIEFLWIKEASDGSHGW
jgi:hypothetical protein